MSAVVSASLLIHCSPLFFATGSLSLGRQVEVSSIFLEMLKFEAILLLNLPLIQAEEAESMQVSY